MNIECKIIIAINTDRFVKPLAELSVTLLWYFLIIEILDLYLTTQKIRWEIEKPPIGMCRRWPVPATFLSETAELPYVMSYNQSFKKIIKQPLQGTC